MALIDHERWRALGPLLDEALELPPAELDAWLAELRGRVPGLAAELEILLAGEAVADRSGFLAAPLLPRAAVPLAGVQLGAYTLERPLGHGGMGSVWLARRAGERADEHADARADEHSAGEDIVAVKLLNLALLTRAGQERFRREGALLARLAHPNITRLLDAGVSAAGQPYLVLEYVDGEPIDVYADAQRLTLDARVRLLLQVLEAVGHAHANLVVHRDLKPTNILVTKDGTVKLLDFGIAKLLDPERGDRRSTFSLEAGRALTPEYASPEQVRGDPVTKATDVYALGVLLYRLAAGRHPTSEGAKTATDAIRTLLEVEPARLGGGLGALDDVLARALRKDPSARHQTVAAFADDLARWLHDGPARARAGSLLDRAAKFVRRNLAAGDR